MPVRDVGELLDAVVDHDAAPLHQPVGVEHQGRAHVQDRRRVGPRPGAGQPERRAHGRVQQPRRVRVGHHRRRMAGQAVGEPPGGRVQEQAGDGRDPRAVDPGGEAVEQFQRPRGRMALQQQGGDGAAQLAHHRRRGRALADDVAHHERDPAVVEGQHVVPVATGLGADDAGQVARADREAVEPGQPARQEAALERVGDLAPRVGQRGPLERHRRLGGQGEQEGALVRPERARSGEAGRERAHHPPTGEQRQGDGGLRRREEARHRAREARLPGLAVEEPHRLVRCAPPP